MRHFIFTIALLLSICINAQVEPQYKDVFLRVYNLEGKKIAKGRLLIITDQSMTLYRRKQRIEISIQDIGKIRTKRSFGNNVVKGAAIGGGIVAVIGAASAPNDDSLLSYTPAEGAILGTVIGGFYGGGIGAITGIFKNSKAYIIDGESARLEVFKNLVIKTIN